MEWETPFSEDMLGGNPYMIIKCPSRDSFIEAVELLKLHGIKFCLGLDYNYYRFWDIYKEDTHLYVERDRLTYGSSEPYSDNDHYNRFLKCTSYADDPYGFSSAQNADIDGLFL